MQATSILSSQPPQAQKKVKAKKRKAGFKSKHYVVTASVAKYIQEKLEGFNQDSKELYMHIFKCSAKKRHKTDGWVPLSYHDFIIKEFWSAEVERLVAEGRIERTEYEIASTAGAGRCREYRIPEADMLAVTDLAWKDWSDAESIPPDRTDLVSGRAVRGCLIKSITTDESNNKVAQLVVDHIQLYEPCLFNKVRAMNYLAQLKETNRLKYISDSQSLHLILNECGATHYLGELWIYKAPYKPQKSGRITHIGGGFQNASRALQAALFADIPNYHNYDLKSSQNRLLVHYLDEAGIDSSWMKRYVSDPNGKHEMAKRIGVSVDTWKAILNATVMSAATQTFTTRKNLLAALRTSKASILKYLMEEAKTRMTPEYLQGLEHLQDLEVTDERKAFEVAKYAADRYELFLAETTQLRESISLWHKHLLSTYCSKPGRQSILNACGMKLRCTINAKGKVAVEGAKDGSCGPAGLIAAHLLQGHEAAIIAQLGKLSAKYGYRLVQNYHDGFICEGIVPQAAVQEAAALCHAPNIALEEKPFKTE